MLTGRYEVCSNLFTYLRIFPFFILTQKQRFKKQIISSKCSEVRTEMQKYIFWLENDDKDLAKESKQ